LGTPSPVIITLRVGFKKAAHRLQFVATLENLGQELDYLDQPEFAKFWEIDAKRQEDAINSIGRVQG
jgi:tripartite-type tricarboxylate transporter receptor subunit TctC